MKIELRELEFDIGGDNRVVEYRAEIWIDGELAFEASSDGDFGEDVFVQVGRITIAEIDAWLGDNRPPEIVDGERRPADLALEVAGIVDTAAYTDLIERKLRHQVIAIEDDAVKGYTLVGTRQATIAALRKRNPSALIVTGEDQTLIVRAAQLLFRGAPPSLN